MERKEDKEMLSRIARLPMGFVPDTLVEAYMLGKEHSESMIIKCLELKDIPKHDCGDGQEKLSEQEIKQAQNQVPVGPDYKPEWMKQEKKEITDQFNKIYKQAEDLDRYSYKECPEINVRPEKKKCEHEIKAGTYYEYDPKTLKSKCPKCGKMIDRDSFKSEQPSQQDIDTVAKWLRNGGEKGQNVFETAHKLLEIAPGFASKINIF